MGMFIPEDKFYDETKRQTGFNRYKQLLGRHFGDWFKLNALTILGLLPLAAGIGLAIASSSILVLIPCSLLGGMIFGPFLSGMYDSLFRAMRDDPMPMWQNYQKSWKQNFLGSLAPWTLLILPIVGIWYILFLSQFLLYDRLNNAFGIEEQFRQAEKS